MATLDEVLARARTLLDIAGRKTGEVVELSKLKYSKLQIENELSRSYEKLGALCYKGKKGDPINEELVDLCVSEIDDLLATLEGIEQKIRETRDMA